MRGIYLSIIWIMALAVTIAYASKDFTPARLDPEEKVEKVERIEKPEKESKKEPKRLAKKDDDDDDDDDQTEIEDEDHGFFSLEMGYNFGSQQRCFIANCSSFIPVQNMCGGAFYNQCMPPAMPARMPAHAYGEVGSNYMLRPGGCACAGSPICGCSNQPTTNVMMVNHIQPMPPLSGLWNPFAGQTNAAFLMQPQHAFVVPREQQQNPNNPRDFGFTPRLGVTPHSGMNQY